MGKSAVAEKFSNEPLSAPLKLQFDYTRSVGPTIGAFVTALRDRKVIGARGSDGRVYVPPPEFDPNTAEPLTDFVGVSDAGTVVSWTWYRSLASSSSAWAAMASSVVWSAAL